MNREKNLIIAMLSLFSLVLICLLIFMTNEKIKEHNLRVQCEVALKGNYNQYKTQTQLDNEIY